MKKKITSFLIFLFLSSCGYEAVYSLKNSENHDFSINKLIFIGERNINIRMKAKLNNYILAKKTKKFDLNISSSKERTIIVKDIAGNATSYRSTITINVQVLRENKFLNNLQIIENFNYDNIANTFDLKNYERQIINDLSERATEKLILKLSNIN